MTAFVGFPHYLHAAALSLGQPASVKDDARRQPAVGQIASLVSQALSTPPGHGRSDTIRRARELAAGLRIASMAADAMVAEMDTPVDADDPPAPSPPTNHRKDK